MIKTIISNVRKLSVIMMLANFESTCKHVYELTPKLFRGILSIDIGLKNGVSDFRSIPPLSF